MIKSLPKSLIKTSRSVLNNHFCIEDAFQGPPVAEISDDVYLLETYQFNNATFDGLDEVIAENHRIMYNRSHPLHTQHNALMPEQKRHVMEYTSKGVFQGAETGSREINRYLIAQHRAGNAPPSKFIYHDGHEVNLDEIDNAIASVKLNQPLVTFSGIKYNPHDLMDGKSHVHLPAYTSSSLDPRYAISYGHNSSAVHMLAIHHRKHQSALYMAPRSGLSAYSEYEILIPRNQLLHITIDESMHGTTSDGTPIKIWKAIRL